MNDFQSLKEYIVSLNLIDSDKVTLDTSVEEDLGITGDDAIDFIEDFATQFHVEIENFNYSKYFKEEGVNFISVLFSKYSSSTRTPLTLRHLLNSMKTGKLE